MMAEDSSNVEEDESSELSVPRGSMSEKRRVSFARSKLENDSSQMKDTWLSRVCFGLLKTRGRHVFSDGSPLGVLQKLQQSLRLLLLGEVVEGAVDAVSVSGSERK